MKKKIAIIKDGYSDFMVLKSFISKLFVIEQNINIPPDNFIDLQDLKIGDAIDKYLVYANKNNETNLNGKYAKELKNSIINVLYVAITKNNFNNKDILILNGDAEHRLIRRENFFDEWVKRLISIVKLSIDEFYEKMCKQGYLYNNLPIVIPLILFPSIEILVAACFLSDREKQTMRELRAKPDLKNKVWETDNIPFAIETGRINQVLDLCFNSDNNTSLDEIYKEIPEVRNLIHILSYPEK